MASASPNPPPESQLLLLMPSGAETRALRENELRATPANRKVRDLRAVRPGLCSSPISKCGNPGGFGSENFLRRREGPVWRAIPLF